MLGRSMLSSTRLTHRASLPRLVRCGSLCRRTYVILNPSNVYQGTTVNHEYS